MDGKGRGDACWVGDGSCWDRAETFVRDRLANGGGALNAIKDYYYGLFSFVKAMAYYDEDGDGSADPIDFLEQRVPSPSKPPIDWYHAEVSRGDETDGVARTLVSDQAPGGYGWGHNVSGDQYPFETGWAIAMLRATIEPSCVVVLEAVPETAAANEPVTLDCSQSYHLDPSRQIVAWDWDLDGDGEYDDASGPTTVATYPELKIYPVACRATDGGDESGENVRSCSGRLYVRVTIPPIAPTADAGGPYLLCEDWKPWFLDGTASVNPDDGLSEPGRPGGFLKSYAWDLADGGTVDAVGA